MNKTFTFQSENVSPVYSVAGIIYMENGCCKDKPVLITENRFNDGINFSCQCACVRWCTTGHPTVAGAVKDYQTMSNNGIPLEDDYQ
jgi:hypothetical protein